MLKLLFATGIARPPGARPQTRFAFCMNSWYANPEPSKHLGATGTCGPDFINAFRRMKASGVARHQHELAIESAEVSARMRNNALSRLEYRGAPPLAHGGRGSFSCTRTRSITDSWKLIESSLSWR